MKKMPTIFDELNVSDFHPTHLTYDEYENTLTKVRYRYFPFYFVFKNNLFLCCTVPTNSAFDTSFNYVRFFGLSKNYYVNGKDVCFFEHDMLKLEEIWSFL